MLIVDSLARYNCLALLRRPLAEQYAHSYLIFGRDKNPSLNNEMMKNERPDNHIVSSYELRSSLNTHSQNEGFKMKLYGALETPSSRQSEQPQDGEPYSPTGVPVRSIPPIGCWAM